MTGRLGSSYCSRNCAGLSPDRRSMLSTSSQEGSTAMVAQLQTDGQQRHGYDSQDFFNGEKSIN
jgi:hypothetical protein